MKKLKVIHLRHENDRATVPPFFWTVTIDGAPVDPGTPKYGDATTKERAEDIVVELGKKAGVKDTTSHAEWAAAGYEIRITGPVPGTFGNWPEPY